MTAKGNKLARTSDYWRKATGEATETLVKFSVNTFKVGIDRDSICTTSMKAWSGVTQITTIDKVSEALRNSNVPVIADRAVEYFGDIIKAISAWAHTVMIGSLFAWSVESHGKVLLYQGMPFKIYRGMGSLGAIKEGGNDRYLQDHIEEEVKFVTKEIEGRVP